MPAAQLPHYATVAMKLLLKLVEVACIDPQIAKILLQICGGYCKLVHLATSTPPNLASDPLLYPVPVSYLTWQQAQLSSALLILDATLFLTTLRLPTLPLSVLLALNRGIANTFLEGLIVSTALFPGLK